LLFALLVLPAGSPAGAQTNDAEHPGSIQFRVAYEQLSKGYAPWRSASLDVRGSGFSAAVEETTRFSQLDHNITGGVQRHLASRLIVASEAGVSPSHHVSPTWGLAGRVELDAGAGWGLQASLQHRRYTSASVDLSAMTVERYFSRWRAAYTLYLARLRGGEASASHRAQGDLYYGRSSNSVGVSVSTGDELENLQPIGVLRTPVHAASVVGRQWIAPTWCVEYDALVHEQGTFYTRRRVSVGLGYRF